MVMYLLPEFEHLCCSELTRCDQFSHWYWSPGISQHCAQLVLVQHCGHCTGQATDTRGCQDWLSNWSYTNRFILCLDWITAFIVKNSKTSFHTQYLFQGYWTRCISIWWCSKRYIYKSWLQNVIIDDILQASWSAIQY